MRNISEPKSKFLKVSCPACKAEQVIFGKASTKVKCISCKKPIVKPTGGKSVVLAEIKGVI